MTNHNDQERSLKRCAACGEERPVSEMKTCMHNQMHRYVCDSKCMHDFYNPPKQARAQLQPSSVAVPTVATLQMKNAGWQECARQGIYPEAIEMQTIWSAMLAAAPHPVSGDSNPEHTLFNEIRGSMPVNEDDEPTRYIITEAQLQRIRVLEFGQHPVSGEQKPASVQITGHLDEVDAPVWEFINAEARKLGPATGSIDTYNFTRPDGAQPNGVVSVLWNGASIHAMAVTVRDSMNRAQCVRLLAGAPPAAQDVSGLTLIEAGNPLSNAAYNLAQKPGHVITAYDCELLAELRKRWDEALAAHRAQAQGGDT